jgi:formamidopyrimidine-DNA glycosylase
MPELPEVETMRRGIAPIVGSRIVGARRMPCARRPIADEPSLPTFVRRSMGRKIAEVGRLGKRVVLRLDNDDRLIFEPRMTGLVLLAAPPTVEH